jgi:hypothetical protein
MTSEDKGDSMEIYEYIVGKIDGDYAHIVRVDQPDDDPKLVARAILPAQIIEGTHLRYEYLEYNIIEQ